jgi:hypothetical protein
VTNAEPAVPVAEHRNHWPTARASGPGSDRQRSPMVMKITDSGGGKGLE